MTVLAPLCLSQQPNNICMRGRDLSVRDRGVTRLEGSVCKLWWSSNYSTVSPGKKKEKKSFFFPPQSRRMKSQTTLLLNYSKNKAGSQPGVMQNMPSPDKLSFSKSGHPRGQRSALAICAACVKEGSTHLVSAR